MRLPPLRRVLRTRRCRRRIAASAPAAVTHVIRAFVKALSCCCCWAYACVTLYSPHFTEHSLPPPRAFLFFRVRLAQARQSWICLAFPSPSRAACHMLPRVRRREAASTVTWPRSERACTHADLRDVTAAESRTPRRGVDFHGARRPSTDPCAGSTRPPHSHGATAGSRSRREQERFWSSYAWETAAQEPHRRDLRERVPASVSGR